MTGPLECRYVFLDIVGYSKRTVEAQTDISAALNRIVREALESAQIPSEVRLLIPTGDGICIVVAPFKPEFYNRISFDAHLDLACRILEGLESHNSATDDEARRFSVRIGVNENVDNAIIDINDNQNVAGSGINASQRIMSTAEGAQIMLGLRVHDVLRSREKYVGHGFREYRLTAKHGERLQAYQYLGLGNEIWLNHDVPSEFRRVATARPKLSLRTACFIVEADVHRAQFIEMLQKDTPLLGALTALWMRSADWVTYLSTGQYDSPNYYSDGFPNKDVIKYARSLRALPFTVIYELEEFIREKLGIYSAMFEESSYAYLFPKLEAVAEADTLLAQYGDGPREAIIRKQQRVQEGLATAEEVFKHLSATGEILARLAKESSNEADETT